MRRAERHPRSVLFKRHTLAVRITHWINVLCIAILLMSGMQIFNAHPALYFGNHSDFDAPALSLPAFPGWLTIPSFHDLGTGRHWHFLFAWIFVINGAAYLLHAVVSGHARRDLLPKLRDWREIGPEIRHHIRLRFPKGEAARRYNVLQKLTYAFVAFVLLPVLVLAGLTMSPALDAVFPWLVDLFGGRQTARTIHFIAAASIVLFILVHVAMVLLSGVWNNMRSMVTGRYRIELDERDRGAAP
jgi:Ni/Fe-hydrogenase b-type cytochrome subunit